MGRSGIHSCEIIAAVSGGPDSVFLVHWCRKSYGKVLLGHLNHGARGKESDEDQRFVERMSRRIGLPLEVRKVTVKRSARHRVGGKDEKGTASIEERGRKVRYSFLFDLMDKCRAKKILVAHTADDQVETVLMRIMEGAGIAGLKGIPKETDDGIERPLLATWRKDILAYLHRHGIEYRVDRSNRDTRFERNWIRHVLIPLLEERYGKSVRKRIFTLGERFRELDVFIESTARKWLNKQGVILLKDKGTKTRDSSRDGKREERGGSGKKGRRPGRNWLPATEAPLEEVRIRRKAYIGLPSVVRVKILQILCFEHIGKAPSERLLMSMDRLIVSGMPSGRLNIGKGATLRCRYGDAIFSLPEPGKKSGKRSEEPGKKAKRGHGRTGKAVDGRTPERLHVTEPVVRMDGPGRYRWSGKKQAEKGSDAGRSRFLLWEESPRAVRKRIRRLAKGDHWVAFDGEAVASPLSIRPLRMGDRIRPFGLETEKKVKEILIDRKVPREQRWGRPVVCDPDGVILWIPGLVRSAHAPVTRRTKHMIVLRTDNAGAPPSEDGLHRESSMLN